MLCDVCGKSPMDGIVHGSINGDGGEWFSHCLDCKCERGCTKALIESYLENAKQQNE